MTELAITTSENTAPRQRRKAETVDQRKRRISLSKTTFLEDFVLRSISHIASTGQMPSLKSDSSIILKDGRMDSDALAEMLQEALQMNLSPTVSVNQKISEFLVTKSTDTLKGFIDNRAGLIARQSTIVNEFLNKGYSAETFTIFLTGRLLEPVDKNLQPEVRNGEKVEEIRQMRATAALIYKRDHPFDSSTKATRALADRGFPMAGPTYLKYLSDYDLDANRHAVPKIRKEEK